MSHRTWAVGYLLLQALGGVAWWIGVLASPSFRDGFVPPGAPDFTLLAFIGADALLFVGGSALSAWFVARRDARRSTVLWFTSGAVSYAALCAIGLGFAGAPWIGALIMFGAAVLTVLTARGCP